MPHDDSPLSHIVTPAFDVVAEALLEHVTDLVAVLDADGLFRYASPSYQRLLGYSPAQVPGTSVFALVHPEDVAFVHALRAEGARLTVTCRWRHADGSWRRIESTGSNRLADPLVRGLVVTSRDIAEHERAPVAVTKQVRARDHVEQQRATTELAAQLARERALLAAVVQQMPGGVLIAEAPSGRLILANARAEQIWRYPFREGASVMEYRQCQGFHPDGRPYRLEEWPLARAITGGETVMDEAMTIRRGDGTQGTILVSAATVRDARGPIVAGVVTFHDITTLKDLEHAREEFLSSAVHDLKAPLTTIHGYTQLAQQCLAGLDAADAAAALKHLARIDESTRRMVSLINALEDTTRAQMGIVLDLDRQPTDVVALVRCVVEQQQAITAHQVHVEAAVPTLEGTSTQIGWNAWWPTCSPTPSSTAQAGGTSPCRWRGRTRQRARRR